MSAPANTETRLRPRWYQVRVHGPVTWVLCGLLVWGLYLGVRYWWATTPIRASGATIQHYRKGGYSITLSKEGKAALLLNPGISRLNYLDDYKSLNLSGTDVTDEELVYLDRLDGPFGLKLANTKVTDLGVAHLANLSNLCALDLSGTRITDASILHLTKLRDLCRLNLAGTCVTDKGLRFPTPPLELNMLDLRDTSISDAAIPQLTKLRYLHDLNLEGTRVSDAGIEALRRALPNDCHVRH
jgi:hypothetical protein